MSILIDAASLFVTPEQVRGDETVSECRSALMASTVIPAQAGIHVQATWRLLPIVP
ncbi:MULTISPECIES: hypothetical protein [unclassified Sphingomonas]|uniref:hypothetical protein n=1 Tax=unclassified Sphingomonas TaxID=196159 RepID=UPI000B1C259D|nr:MULTISPECIES: hypothetical protein [unclassified Sphingomonas]